mgnify:CR=1 FL=1
MLMMVYLTMNYQKNDLSKSTIKFQARLYLAHGEKALAAEELPSSSKLAWKKQSKPKSNSHKNLVE